MQVTTTPLIRPLGSWLRLGLFLAVGCAQGVPASLERVEDDAGPIAESAAALTRTCEEGACEEQACALDGPVTCALDEQGLSIHAAGRTLTLLGQFEALYEGGAPVQGRYVGQSDQLAIATPMGPIALPTGSTLTVTCEPSLAISGRLTGMPSFADAGNLAWLGVEASAGGIELGFALGRQLAHLDAPLDACSPYLFLAITDRLALSFGDGRLVTHGDALTLAFDPTDPSFLFDLAGSTLSTKTGLPISRIAMGHSRAGKLAWTSAFDLPLGPGSSKRAPAQASGHIYRRGQVSLIPVKTPVQVKLDGTLVVDLGAFPEAAEALGEMLLVAGDLDDLGERLAELGLELDPEALLDQAAIAANVESLSVHYDVFQVSLGRAALLQEDGVLRFAGEAENIGRALTLEGDSSLARALDSILVQHATRIRGAIDTRSGDRYRLEIEGDFKIGPFSVPNATLTIDSEHGVKVDAGFDFDLMAFVQSLEQLLTCDYADSQTSCTLAGYEVTSLRAELEAGGPKVFLKLDMFGFFDGEFEAAFDANGHFAIAANIDRLPGSGPPPLTATSGRLEIQHDAVLFRGAYASLDLGAEVSGFVRADAARRRVSFSFTGQGTKAFIPGAPALSTTLTITNVDPEGQPIDVRAALRVALDPSQLTELVRLSSGQPFVELTGDLRVDHGDVRYTLAGTADLTIVEFPLLGAALSLSNEAGPTRLTVDVPLKLPQGLLDTRLRGEIKKGDFLLVGTGSAVVPVVPGYALSGSARLNPQGLFVDGEIALGAGRARGTVTFTKDFHGRFTGEVLGQAGFPPYVTFAGTMTADAGFGPPERIPFLRVRATGGVRVGGVPLTSAQGEAYAYVRTDGITIAGSLKTPLSVVAMSGKVLGDTFDLKGKASFSVPMVSEVTAVTSEIVSGTKSGFQCVKTSASCGYDYVDKWVDAVGKCFSNIRWKCKEKLFGKCIITLPYCTVRTPKPNCHECKLTRGYRVSLGDIRGEVDLAITNQTPALRGTAKLTGMFCNGSSCESPTSLSTSVETGNLADLRVCAKIPGSRIAARAQSALQIPAEFRVSAPDQTFCGQF